MINSNLFKQSGKKSGETPEVRCDKKKPREETKDTEEIEETEETEGTEETDIEEVEEMLKFSKSQKVGARYSSTVSL